MEWVTAHVSAGAYLKGDKRRVWLTHLALVDLSSFYMVKQVACRRVQPGSILPDSSTFSTERPTCRQCGKAWDDLPKGLQHR